MANKTLFGSMAGRLTPAADAINEAGGKAYRLESKAALAQYAVTGCLNGTFYASAETQLSTVMDLCTAKDMTPEYVARVALYARTRGQMKDMPALLCAVLSVMSPGLLAEIFDRVIDDGRMLRNFVQIMRSGVVMRKSLGTLPKRLVCQWLEKRTDEQLFRASVGNDPSLADVIRMVHPKPTTASRAALYGYLLGKAHDHSALPTVVKELEAFKAGKRVSAPDVPFQMLTGLALTPAHWKQIARNASWQMTRMNLNTFMRHGVLDDTRMVGKIADRLRDAKAIERARALPYQLLLAYKHAGANLPRAVREALQDAMEVATRNVPAVNGKVYVFPDISGSMDSPVTGYRKGATSAATCRDVAALVAACFLRTNRATEVIPFSDEAVVVTLNPRDSVMTNAHRLASLPSGGTNCSAPLRLLNGRKAEGDLIIYVSDNQSWMDKAAGHATAMMDEWSQFKARNPSARMACIDLQPYSTVQAVDSGHNDVLNIGGFSDGVFEVITAFTEGSLSAEHWVGVIEAVRI